MGVKLKRNSPQRAKLRHGCARGLIAALAAGTSANAVCAAGMQPGQTLQAQERHVVIDSAIVAPPGAGRLNTTGRDVTLTIPAKDGATYLGDIILTVHADDKLEFSAQRLLDLLANVLDPDVLRTLQGSFAGKTVLSPSDFQASGIVIKYDPQELALNLIIGAERRARQTVQVAPMDPSRIGGFVKPAEVSAYLNIRGNLDYVHSGFDKGLQSPVMFLDGAARIGGIVAESEAIWQPGARGTDFQRLGSRAVFDDVHNLVRWTAGDLQAVARGFQSAPDMAGISVFRSYSVLQPQMVVRPRGDRQFRLDRPSTVEVQVNGQIVQRLQLAPGTYDLRNFPFTQGANDIRLAVLDDTGRSELLRFNVFLDQSQLAKGLSEFGAYAGVLAPLEVRGPHYTDQIAFTGFYRRGITDYVTLGGNFQSDRHSRLGGVEGVFATGLGTFGASFSISDINHFGTGYGTIVTFQRLIQRGGGRADSLNLSFEARSRVFGPMGTVVPLNPYKWEVGGGYSHAFNDYVYAGLDGRYSEGRGTQRNVYSMRGTVGWRINANTSFTADGRYDRDNRGSRIAALLSLTIRLGRYSSVRADYDTNDNKGRLTYQTIHGQGVGSYNLSADVERSDIGSGVNAVANYFANRAELGLSHFGTFTSGFGNTTSERTSLRFATSLAMADGAFSVGRPIYDSFAIVQPHAALHGADVLLEPTPFGYTASSGVLGAATHPSLSSYAERTITVDVPGAPAGVDLGQGSFRLFPPYRSGYRLTVGSAYNVTAIGRMLNRDGEPVALVTGTAVELAHPDREPVAMFTNREGRFGAVGLAPGRWRVRMLDDQKSVFVIDVPAKAEGVLRLGDIRPSGNGE
jgi:outer membrane usher protein